MADDSEEPRAVDGRVPGSRGRATRQRLLDQTNTLLDSTAFRELKVVDIAKAARTSPATFYQYFPDVESAVFALAEQMVATNPLVDVIEAASWVHAEAFGTSMKVVDTYLDFFGRYHGVLRVVDLLTGEGDDRFLALRSRMMGPAARALSEVIAEHQATDDHDRGFDPMAQAGVLIVALAHVSTRRSAFESSGISSLDLRDTLARQLCWGATGLRPVE